eukprot:10886693-Heterocapsa_arctica.AAC.1
MNTDPPQYQWGNGAAKTAAEIITLMSSQPPGEPGNMDQEVPYLPGSNSTYHDWPTPVSTQFTLALKRVVECMLLPDNLARDMTEVNRKSHSPSLPTPGEIF